MAKKEIPILMILLFGDAATLAMETPSPRLLCWCKAFEDWLEDRRHKCELTTYNNTVTIWKRFLGRIGKFPWDISQPDVKAYIGWLQMQGLAPSSIKLELSYISVFYKWCKQHHIDAEHGEILNPTEGVQKPKIRNYANAKVLNLDEARALLAVLRMDEAILTKRDYAFILARLRVGVPNKYIQQLRWGQIWRDETGTWVDWGRGEAETERGGGPETAPLPEEVYEAIVDYLRAAGRLEGMRAEAYIFAPLVDALRQEASGKAEEWNERRFLGNRQFLRAVKRYGGLAGIANEKLTLFALRHTATMLRVEAGDSLEEIQEFLHGPQLEVTKNYLKALPIPDVEKEALRDLEADPPQFPERKPNRNEPWGGMIHGMAARRQPPEEVAAILAEEIRGMEEEITGLRLLHRDLLEMQRSTTEPVEVALLTDAYTRSAARLAKMIKIEEDLKKRRQKDDWPEEFLARLAEGAKERGEEFDIEKEKDLAWGGEGALAANARRLAEEIAGMRVALRRTYQRATESQQVHRRVYLTDVYGRGCKRLVQLLQLEGDGQTRLKIYINQVVDDVILGITEEWGLR